MQGTGAPHIEPKYQSSFGRALEDDCGLGAWGARVQEVPEEQHINKGLETTATRGAGPTFLDGACIVGDGLFPG